jgi:hypothetical protein
MKQKQSFELVNVLVTKKSIAKKKLSKGWPSQLDARFWKEWFHFWLSDRVAIQVNNLCQICRVIIACVLSSRDFDARLAWIHHDTSNLHLLHEIAS